MEVQFVKVNKQAQK